MRKQIEKNQLDKNCELGCLARIPIQQIVNNEGQIKGVPKNPRYLKESEHDKLVKSMTDSPEFLEYKPLMVYSLEDGTYVTICGNMRLRVANELRIGGNTNFEKLPCFVLKADTPIQKIKEYAIKDNVQAGNWDWDDLANDDWDVTDLDEWGVETSFLVTNDADIETLNGLFEEDKGENDKEKDLKISILFDHSFFEKADEIKDKIKDTLGEEYGIIKFK